LFFLEPRLRVSVKGTGGMESVGAADKEKEAEAGVGQRSSSLTPSLNRGLLK